MEENKIKIFSYAKVWKVEKKIYAISRFSLPRPISPYDLLAFAGVVLCMMLFSKLIPLLAVMPVIIRYIGIPYAIVAYLTKKKLDGKNPLKYFSGCILYFFTVRGTYLQLFHRNRNMQKKEKITLNWNCSMGVRQK